VSTSANEDAGETIIYAFSIGFISLPFSIRPFHTIKKFVSPQFRHNFFHLKIFFPSLFTANLTSTSSSAVSEVSHIAEEDHKGCKTHLLICRLIDNKLLFHIYSFHIIFLNIRILLFYFNANNYFALHVSFRCPFLLI
jgi:hypothetical protein